MEYRSLTMRESGCVLYVTISNPPINLLNFAMVDELLALAKMLDRRQHDIRVVVIDSADPDFWIAHFDVHEIGKRHDAGRPPLRGNFDRGQQSFTSIQTLSLKWQDLPQITIGKVNGRVRGGGVEFLLALDMRFASQGSIFGQPESDADFLACGGGATRSFMLAGHARAMEILLSARDFTAFEYERYNLINRALPADELDGYVQDLVDNLALRSGDVIAMHRNVSRAVAFPLYDAILDGMSAEIKGLQMGLKNGAIEASVQKMKRAGQSRENELDLPATLARLR